MSDIFISYARSTATQARAMGEALRALGYSVWRDDEIPAHRAYTDVIEEQLDAAKAVVVIWSAEAARSQWVRSEADRARGADKLVQLALDPTRLPMPFDQIECADLAGWSGDTDHPGWLKTLGSIGALVGAPASVPTAMADEAVGLTAGNLPRRQGRLIGREAELAQIGSLFETSDLVTVTGAGGVGKTRIALEYAHERNGAHEDGVWLVELAPLTDADQVVGAVARALGVDLPPGRPPLDALLVRLKPRDTLIVLDNCEHVIDAVAALAEAVLEQTSQVKLLASSQELIGVEGERVFRLRSLGEADAAALFVERARAADAGFAPRAADEPVIAAICQRLDGIPLAVEMAAARAPALGCEGVLKRLDDRFRILTGGRRTALPRQRTLQATLDWSCGLLSAEDAAVFRRLGVFTGGFSLEAAGRVAADERLDELEVIDAVAGLVAKSLVTADVEGDRTRYRLLETTRMYALEQLAAAGETSGVQRAHAAYFADLARHCAPDYRSISDEAFHARWAPEMANIEKAIDWAFDAGGDDALGIRLTALSWAAWAALSRITRFIPWAITAMGRLGPQVSAEDSRQLRRATISACANWAPFRVPDLAAELLAELRAEGDPADLGDALQSATVAHRLLGREDEANAFAAELAELLPRLPVTRLNVSYIFSVAQRAMVANDGAAMRARLAEGTALADKIGASGFASMMRAETAGDPELHPEEGIEGARAVLQTVRPSHMFVTGTIINGTYMLAYWLARRHGDGDLDEAYRLVRGLEKINGRVIVGRWMHVLSILALQDGRPKDAARLLGAGRASARQIGIDFAASRRGHAQLLGELGEHLDETQIEACAAEGERMTQDQVYDLAMKLG